MIANNLTQTSELSKTSLVFFPSAKSLYDDGLFSDIHDPDHRLEPFRMLKRKWPGPVLTFDKFNKKNQRCIFIVYRFERHVYNLLDKVLDNPDAKIIYVMSEPADVCPYNSKEVLRSFPFQHFLTYFSVNDDDRFTKYFYPNPKLTWKGEFGVKRKNLIAMISSGKKPKVISKTSLYDQRREFAFEGLERGMHLYGTHWKPDDIANFDNFFGAIRDKSEVLKNYDFALCVENTMDKDSSITEKIFDCISAGTIPLYLGHPDIQNEIPENCYIDLRQFDCLGSAFSYIRQMTVAQKDVHRNAMREFLNSEAYKKFTSEGYCDRIFGVIEGLDFRNVVRLKKSEYLKSIFVSRGKFFHSKRAILGFICAVLR